MACVTCHGAEGEGLAAAGFPRLAASPPAILKNSWPILLPAHAPTDHATDCSSLDGRGSGRGNGAARQQTVTTGQAHPAAPRRPAVRRRACIAWRLGSQYSGVRVLSRAKRCRRWRHLSAPCPGQSAQYLSAQLVAWQQGTRKNDPNDLMGHIARSLSQDEVNAVSQYASPP